MKKKISIITLIAIVTAIAVFVVYRNLSIATPVTDETPFETNSYAPPPTETTVPTQAEETTVPPTIDVNEALTNVWRIVDNDCVEEIPILPGLLIDDIKEWMETTEYKEIKLYQRTNWNTVRLGVFGDMAVAQMTMDVDDDLVWNVRMEKADKLENKTSIVIPDFAETDTWRNYSPDVPVLWYHWSNDDGTWTEMYIVFFEETQHLYTFYSNEIVYKYTGDTPTYETITYRNSNRGPSVVINNIENENLAMYSHITEDEIRAAKGKNDIRYFRIQTTDSCETYQYRFGDTVQQWVNSKYNTDGWHILYEKGKPYVVSADNRFMLNCNDYVWRTMKAGIYHYSAD